MKSFSMRCHVVLNQLSRNGGTFKMAASCDWNQLFLSWVKRFCCCCCCWNIRVLKKRNFFFPLLYCVCVCVLIVKCVWEKLIISSSSSSSPRPSKKMATKRDRKTAFPFIKPKGSIKKDVQQYRYVAVDNVTLVLFVVFFFSFKYR